ncbi:uncharacterized protein LOC112167063 isoform X2 [Rosa chinensis]|uniref:uncharacterized protein LOC112167063 isoform X2 n=1 Tax=Rosa chinensis TaxID=74649 RepID=UPI000D090931|nr:uncharacterized protein LOC112167063 isoform X2 [Rosa chinensis]
MEASISSFTLIRTPTKSNSSTAIFPSINITKPYDSCSITRTKCHNLAFAINTTPTLRGRKAWKTAAIEDVSGAITDPGPVVLTWQIVVGAIVRLCFCMQLELHLLWWQGLNSAKELWISPLAIMEKILYWLAN